MERRDFESEIRIELKGDDNSADKIYGTAAIFYREGEEGTQYDLAGYGLPGVKERIMPGAFNLALGRTQGGTQQKKADVYAAVNHDPSQVFARTSAGTLSVWQDESGLHYEAQPAPTTIGRDAVANAQAGNFGGSSFAFKVAEKNGERWTKDGDTEVREILKIDALVDVSPVTTPAYKSTDVSARQAQEIRESYETWKGGDQESDDTVTRENNEYDEEYEKRLLVTMLMLNMK